MFHQQIIFHILCICLFVYIYIYIYIYNRTHVIRILRGPRNLFGLHDYSNYRSSDYMSSTVCIYMCTCVYVYVCVYMCICLYIYIYVCIIYIIQYTIYIICVLMHICICVYTYMNAVKNIGPFCDIFNMFTKTTTKVVKMRLPSNQ